MPSAKLSVSNHGHFLVQELENSSFPKDLRIVCLDGNVDMHKVLLAPMLVSSALLKAIKQNNEDDVIQILLPDTTKCLVERLAQLLYTGCTASFRGEQDIGDLKSLSNILNIDKLSLSVQRTNVDEKDNTPGDLQIEIIERKKLPRRPIAIAPEDAGIRRSKRPRFKAKKLEDFETKSQTVETGETAKEEKRTSESRVTEKTISNLVVRVTEPKEEALELQKQSSLPSGIVKICLVCDKKLLGKYALSKHLKSKHGHGSFDCKYCGEMFTSGHEIHEHVRQKKHQSSPKAKKSTYRCDINACVQSFLTFNAFQAHCLNVHQMFPLECKICKKRYKEQATFRNHTETHLNQLNYECDFCSKKFVTRERLFAHRRLHLGKRYQCSQSQCDFKARSSSALRNHIKMKHLDRRFQCTTCEKKFASKQNLEQHEVIHTGTTSWHCCDMSFKRLHHFKAHLNSHSHKARVKEGSSNTALYKCDICLLTFKFDHLLREHQKSKAHLAKAEELENSQHVVGSTDFSLVIPPQFNDEDLINLADNNFLDDSNVQFIIVNEASQNVMLISDEVKLSDAATEENSLIM